VRIYGWAYTFSNKQTPDHGKSPFGPSGSGIFAYSIISSDNLFNVAAVFNFDLDSTGFHPKSRKNSSPSAGANFNGALASYSLF